MKPFDAVCQTASRGVTPFDAPAVDMAGLETFEKGLATFEKGRLAQNLHADGALPRNHQRVVERRNEDQAIRSAVSALRG